MSTSLLTHAQIDRMLQDSATVERMHPQRYEVCDLFCHVKALAADHKKLRAVADAARAVVQRGRGSDFGELIERLREAGYELLEGEE